MKKIFIVASLMMMTLVSCNKESSKKGNTPLSPDEQKTKVENTTQDLMSEFPVEDYEAFFTASENLTNAILQILDNGDYDLTEIEGVLEERLGRMITVKELSETVTSHTYLFLLADIKGHFTFGKDKLTYKDSDSTIIEVTDDKGVAWKITLTPSGAAKKVYFGEFEKNWAGIYDNQTGSYGERHSEIYDLTIEVPEKLDINITENGKNFASVSLGLSFNVSEGGLDIEKDSFSVSCAISFVGLEINLSKLAYNASTGAFENSFSLKNNGKLIIAETVSANAKFDFDNEDWSAKNLNVTVDIMGEMQFKGSCADVKKLVETFDNSARETENDWEKLAEEVNKLFTLGVYFDGGNLVQAKLILEPKAHTYGYGLAWVIEFNDGSKFQLEEYLEDESFDDTYDDLESFIGSYLKFFARN